MIAGQHEPQSKVQITFDDTGGVSRALLVRMPMPKGAEWVRGLQALLKLIPRLASPAHWRWSRSCLAATGGLGAVGFLRRSDIRSLLRRANASPHASAAALESTLEAVVDEALLLDDDEQRQMLPWLRAAQTSGQRLLDTPRVAEFLFRLSTSSRQLEELFNSHAAGGDVSLAEWLAFIRTEQLSGRPYKYDFSSSPGHNAIASNEEDDSFKNESLAEPPEYNVVKELARAEERFESAALREATESRSSRGLSLLQFSLELLAPHNRAVATCQDLSTKDKMHAPLAHYWNATSHK